MTPRTNPPAVLIVEDEIFVALDLERILTDAGYQVKGIAADRSTALQQAQDCSFALVDINLRDGPTGPDLARTLTEEYGLKVIFVTANPGQIDVPCKALGYVRKPFKESSILAAAALATTADRSVAANDDLVLIDPDLTGSAAGDAMGG